MSDNQPTNKSIDAKPIRSTPSRLPEAVLVVIPAIWGTNYFGTSVALRECGPVSFLSIRFTIAAAVLLLLFRSRIRRLTIPEVSAGAAIGLTLFAAYVLQTVGMLYITIGKSAFITAMYVPLVPILQFVLLAKPPGRAAWVGIFLAFAGLLLLTCGEELEFDLGVGEWLTLGCAMACALQIILIGRWAPGADPFRLAFVQIVVVAVLCLAVAPFTGEHLPTLTPTLAAAALELGVVGTAFVLVAMNWAQGTITPTRATVIYATEPVWAAAIGALTGHGMTTMAVAGSALILIGVVANGLRGRPTSAGT